MIQLLDTYAIALSLLVGAVGFGMTFFFNTKTSEWGPQEIVYPALAMVSANDENTTASLFYFTLHHIPLWTSWELDTDSCGLFQPL